MGVIGLLNLDYFNMKIYRKLKPFSPEKAEMGKPVSTQNGLLVGNLKIDKNNFTISGIIKHNDETEEEYQWDYNGECLENPDYDLKMIPEKREGWVNIYKSYRLNKRTGSDVYKTEEEAKRYMSKGYIDTIKIEWEE